MRLAVPATGRTCDWPYLQQDIPETDWIFRQKIGNKPIEKKLLIRIAQSILGWAFVVIGFLGIFLPLLQGVLFIVIGLTILSTHSAFAKRMLARLENKYPEIYAKVERLKTRFAESKPLLVTLGTLLVVLLGVGIYLAVLGFKTAYVKIVPILMS